MTRPATQLVLRLLLFLIISTPPVIGQVAALGDDALNDGKETPAANGQTVRRERLELALREALADHAGNKGSGTWSGFGLGVGLLAFTDQQGSLRNTLSQSTVTLRDPFGGESTTVLDGDSELNNRKFDFELDLKGGGVYIPIKLPSLGGKSSHSFTLGLEIAEADVSFETLDRTAESALSSSFNGSGPMVGVVLGTRVCASPLCRSIWSASYSYRWLPRLGVDRGIVPGDERFAILEDSTSFRREAHEVSTRFGHSLGSSDRFYAPYAGILYRDVEVEIEDRIRLLDGLEIESVQDTLSRFASDSVYALVGFEAQLSESIVGELESFAGEGDYGVRFQMTWSNKGDVPHEWREKKSNRRENRSRKRADRIKKRLSTINYLIGDCLDAIAKDFERKRNTIEALPTGDRETFRRAEELLDDTKERLVALFSRGVKDPGADASCSIDISRRQHRDLKPFRGYILYQYGQSLEELAEASLPAGRPALPSRPEIAVVNATYRPKDESIQLAQNRSRRSLRQLLDAAFDLPLLRALFANPNCSFVTIDLSFLPDTSKIRFFYFHDGSPVPGNEWYRNEDKPVFHTGVYGWTLEDPQESQSPANCDLRELEELSRCPLHLIRYPCPRLECALKDRSGGDRGCRQFGGVAGTCPGSSCSGP